MKKIESRFKTVVVDVLTIVLACFMVLFTQMKLYQEINLPLLTLPESPKDIEQQGQTTLQETVISIQNINGDKVFYLNEKPISKYNLFKSLKSQKVTSVVLRGDRDAVFTWKDITEINSKFYACGIRKIIFRLKERSD
jgi:biopolymer transport protein ExbD